MSGARKLSIPALALVAFAALGQSAEKSWLNDEPEFLPVDEAFVLTAEVDGDGALVANWKIADGYYLYRHRFGFKARHGNSATLGEPEIAPGKAKVDAYFGAVEVYYHNARARTPIATEAGSAPEAGSATEAGSVEVGISYQGCAEAGLCYPPQTRWVAVDPGTGAISPLASP